MVGGRTQIPKREIEGGFGITYDTNRYLDEHVDPGILR
jgi:hypothetical protein